MAWTPKNHFIDFNNNEFIKSAKVILAIGKKLGKKTILMSCSTGSTLGIYLEAYNPNLVDAHIMYSPNIDLKDPKSALLAWPWGLQLAQKIMGGETRKIPEDPNNAGPSLYKEYYLQGLVELKAFINHTMTDEHFSKFNDPLLISYYYVNDSLQDQAVSVARMQEFISEISSNKSVVYNRPGNYQTHVLPFSKLNAQYDKLIKDTEQFLEEVVFKRPYPE